MNAVRSLLTRKAPTWTLIIIPIMMAVTYFFTKAQMERRFLPPESETVTFEATIAPKSLDQLQQEAN